MSLSELGSRTLVSFWLQQVFKVWGSFLFLLSRLKHLGWTDATLCFGEIGLWLFTDNTQVCNGEVKEVRPHYNWTIYCSCRINVFFFNLPATLIKLWLSLCAPVLFIYAWGAFPPFCWKVWLILFLFQKVILRLHQPPLRLAVPGETFICVSLWEDLCLRQLPAPLPPQVLRTRSANHADANRSSQMTVEQRFTLSGRFGPCENPRSTRTCCCGPLWALLPQVEVEQMLPVVSTQSLQALTFRTCTFIFCAQARRWARNQHQAWDGNPVIQL